MSTLTRGVLISITLRQELLIKALVLISVMSFGWGLNASGKALFLWLSLTHVEPLSKDHEARAPIL